MYVGYLEMWAFMFFFSLLYLFYNSSHLLNSLLSLEMVSLSVYFIMMFSFLFCDINFMYSLYYLIMVVCEGMLGISLLVGVISLSGNDSISSFFISVN